MNTRSTLNLTDTSIRNLQLSSNSTKQAASTKIQSSKTTNIKRSSAKQESSQSPMSSPSNPFNDLQSTSQSFPEMTDNDDLLELEEIQRKQLNLEKRFLDRIPIFKSSEVANVHEFLSKAEIVFNQLKYSDDIRIVKIEEKSDESCRPFFTILKQNDKITWNDFKMEFPKLLYGLTLSKTLTNDKKISSKDSSHENESDDKPSILDLLRLEVMPFSGDTNARQWFVRIDSKFSELKLSMDDRIEILSYFLVGDATIWFSSNREKIHSYSDFCQLFVRDYLHPNQLPDPIHYDTTRNEQSLLQTPSITNGIITTNPADGVRTKATSPVCHSILSSNSNQNISFNSVISPTISKALIDRFVKDPIKFNGGKEDATGWSEEVEQQFTIMNLRDADKLNLIHICLKGEAHLWYQQNKEKFLSWSIFTNEITKAFTSNLQRDIAFEKLKQYHQSVRQSVNQYYNTMTKLMKQADPEMSETTKVQYLMNGLRPSLSIETRRKYPKTTQDFLEQAKVAEELTTLNTTIIPDSTINEESQSSVYSSSVNLKKSTLPNNLRHYPQSSTTNNPYCSAIQSSTDNRPQYSNKSLQSSTKSYGYTQFSHPRRQPVHSQQSRESQQPSSFSNDHRFSNQDSRYQQQQKQSSQRCSRCGSTNHQALHCHHFENRSQ